MKKSVLAAVVLMGTILYAGTLPPVKNSMHSGEAEIRHARVINLSFASVQLIQKLTKNYLYKGMGIHGSALDREMKDTVESLGRQMQVFENYVSESSRVEGQIKLIQLAENDIEDIVMQKYSQENTQLLLDLGTVVSEAAEGIAKAVESGVKIYKKDSNTRILRLSAL